MNNSRFFATVLALSIPLLACAPDADNAVGDGADARVSSTAPDAVGGTASGTSEIDASSLGIAAVGDLGTAPVAARATVAESDAAFRYPLVDISAVDAGASLEATRCTGVPLADSKVIVTSQSCVSQIDGPIHAAIPLATFGSRAQYESRRTLPIVDRAHLAGGDIVLLVTDRPFLDGLRVGVSDIAEIGALQHVVVDGRVLPPGVDAPDACVVFDCTAEPEVRRYRDRVETVRVSWPVYCAAPTTATCALYPTAAGGAVVGTDGTLVGILIAHSDSWRVAPASAIQAVADAQVADGHTDFDLDAYAIN